MKKRLVAVAVIAVLLATLGACSRVTNSPHEAGAEKTNTFFAGFQERSPKYFDPTASYSIDETPFTYTIFEPLYRFHYLKRPYEVVPRAAEALATPRYYDKAGRELPADAAGPDIAESVYDIKLRKGILYAPHPAFAKDAAGNYRYHALTRESARRPAHAVRFRAPRHTGADGARLCLRHQAAGDHAHQIAVVLADGRAHQRAQGIRRADRKGG